VGVPRGERGVHRAARVLWPLRPARRTRRLAFGAAVGALYAVLYLLLQLEQRALLLGSLLLFAVLAALMVTTRRVDWYALLARLARPGGPAG
jgi:inner membrane protein involved in colicin E2 resistance